MPPRSRPPPLVFALVACSWKEQRRRVKAARRAWAAAGMGGRFIQITKGGRGPERPSSRQASPPALLSPGRGRRLAQIRCRRSAAEGVSTSHGP